MTIPNLIVNYQKDQTVTQLKKAYTESNQMINRSIVDNGEPSNWDWGNETSNANTANFVKTYISPYLSVIQDCGYNRTGRCTGPTMHYLDGKTVNSLNYFYILKLKDGSNLYFNVSVTGTEWDGLYFYVDINGNKKPNILGKDSFSMILYKTASASTHYSKSVNFYGAKLRDREHLISDPSWGCKKEVGNFGGFCGALIQMDGWKIADDYPW